jgi:phosphoglycerate dehydrogenase-like enzyme
LILGFGHIGKALAQLLRAFGVEIVAASRSGAPHPLADTSCRLEEADPHLAKADFVVVAAPLTRETKNFLDSARLARMRACAFLVNLSRGAIVDTLALGERLKQGQLAGAALDVTGPEPLPADHPLWTAPNLILTPHIAAAGAHPGDCERLLSITTENARRFSRGEPLLHIVDCSPSRAA